MRMVLLLALGLFCLGVTLSINAWREPDYWSSEADPCESLKRQVEGFSAELANKTLPRTPEQKTALEEKIRTARKQLEECR